MRHEQLPGIRTGERVTVAGLVLVRQRPGTAKGVIFMTLEDETGIANTIVWAAHVRDVPPGGDRRAPRRVTGPLQSASGVIHVVAEDIAISRRCCGACRTSTARQALAHADEVRRPPVERHRHPRAGDSLVTALKETPDPGVAAQTAQVMPKGRNFH